MLFFTRLYLEYQAHNLVFVKSIVLLVSLYDSAAVSCVTGGLRIY